MLTVRVCRSYGHRTGRIAACLRRAGGLLDRYIRGRYIRLPIGSKSSTSSSNRRTLRPSDDLLPLNRVLASSATYAVRPHCESLFLPILSAHSRTERQKYREIQKNTRKLRAHPFLHILSAHSSPPALPLCYHW